MNAEELIRERLEKAERELSDLRVNGGVGPISAEVYDQQQNNAARWLRERDAALASVELLRSEIAPIARCDVYRSGPNYRKSCRELNDPLCRGCRLAIAFTATDQHSWDAVEAARKTLEATLREENVRLESVIAELRLIVLNATTALYAYDDQHEAGGADALKEAMIELGYALAEQPIEYKPARKALEAT